MSGQMEEGPGVFWKIFITMQAKYALEGSQIYADLKLTETEVVFSLKNVSEQPLNISADELTERFIRGDVPEAPKEADWDFPLQEILRNS